MKTVILAGGLGTRLSEETEVKPKPLVEVGEHPILWHILKHFSAAGFNEFFVCLGYKGEAIKRFFLDRSNLAGSMVIDMQSGRVDGLDKEVEDWRLHLIDTGVQTNTGGRIKRMRPYLDSTFFMTYGDGVSNVDLKALLAHHLKCGKIATLTAVRPPARFGGIVFDGDTVKEFLEKPQAGEGWINGGFMVLEPAVFDFISGDSASFEAETLELLCNEGQLAAYQHDGFWQCMDTLRDKRLLTSLWESSQAPWKTW